MTAAQGNALRALKTELRRLRERLRVLHDRTKYEDLRHGVLALEIAEHAVDETLEHTGLGGAIRKVPNAAAHRRARHWRTMVQNVRRQARTFRRTHKNEDLATALKALEIAEGSLEEVTEHYE